MYVYDGKTIAAAQLGKFSGTRTPRQVRPQILRVKTLGQDLLRQAIGEGPVHTGAPGERM